MDPTRAPDFRPPSTVTDSSQVPPLAASSEIPEAAPIQPIVLADYAMKIDAPLLPKRHRHHSHSAHSSHHTGDHRSIDGLLGTADHHTDANASSAKKDNYKIPRIPEDIQPLSGSSSSEDEYEDEAASQARYSAATAELSEDLLTENELHPPKINANQTADLEEVPHGIVRQAKTLQTYEFPTHRFIKKMKNPNKLPLVIVACGSFSPITYLHLRMFEMAMDAIREQTRFEVVGGYYSPVSDNYKKQGLAPAYHRVRMCELACERTSSWLMVDAWESLQPTYTRTAKVLDHFNEEINIKRGGVIFPDGTKKGVKIMLLAGGDLIESMGEPNVWADEDLHHILGRYGCLIVERTGSDVRSFLLSHDIMYEHRRNVLVIKQLIYNDISSTKVRLFLRRGMSVQYLLPNSVIRYIQEHNLYINSSEPVKQVLDAKD